MAHNIGDCQVLPGTIRYSGHAANATQHLDLILSVSVFQIWLLISFTGRFWLTEQVFSSKLIENEYSAVGIFS